MWNVESFVRQQNSLFYQFVVFCIPHFTHGCLFNQSSVLKEWGIDGWIWLHCMLIVSLIHCLRNQWHQLVQDTHLSLVSLIHCLRNQWHHTSWYKTLILIHRLRNQWHQLVQDTHLSTVGRRSFSVAASMLWNSTCWRSVIIFNNYFSASSKILPVFEIVSRHSVICCCATLLTVV